MTPNDTLTPAPAGTLTIATLATWYFTYCEAKNLQETTLRSYRFKLRYLVETFGDRPPEAVTTQDLRQLTVSLHKDRAWCTQQTNHFIRVIKQFYNYLVNEELITRNPAKRLEKIRQERRFPTTISQRDINRLLSVAPNTFTGVRNRVMMLTLLDTGLRISELTALTLEDVDMGTLQFRVFGKGRKERMVPFSHALARQLVKYLPLRAPLAINDALWVNLEGQALTPHYFARVLRDYSVKACLSQPVHAHLFRHTFATEYLRNGGNPQMLQRILGHVTQTMTQHYVHVTDTDASANHRVASPLEHWQGGLTALRGQKKR